MRCKRGKLFVVECKDRQETFRQRQKYSVTVGAARLPNKLKAGIASWLAYVAFGTGLTFGNPVAAPRLLSMQPSRGDSVNKLIPVSYKDRRETFKEGESYSVRVGTVHLPNRVSAGIASWLAYVAFANDLPFEKEL